MQFVGLAGRFKNWGRHMYRWSCRFPYSRSHLYTRSIWDRCGPLVGGHLYTPRHATCTACPILMNEMSHRFTPPCVHCRVHTSWTDLHGMLPPLVVGLFPPWDDTAPVSDYRNVRPHGWMGGHRCDSMFRRYWRTVTRWYHLGKTWLCNSLCRLMRRSAQESKHLFSTRVFEAAWMLVACS